MAIRILKVHPSDNVLVALADLGAGEDVATESGSLTLTSTVAAKHKIAERTLAEGDGVTMYGVLVGTATKTIPAGSAIGTHNITHASSPIVSRKPSSPWRPPDINRWADKTFDGYHRPDGQVGTQNLWLVVPLVFCENRNVLVLKEAFERQLGYAPPRRYESAVAALVERYKSGAQAEQVHLNPSAEAGDRERVFPNVDGIKFLTHDGGCGGTREDSRTLCSLLAGYINHPNVAGATVLSLGCQISQISLLREELEKRNPNIQKPLIILEQQNTDGESDLMGKAIEGTFNGVSMANTLTRRPAPLSKLTIGMECGGSDGFSGLSANPALGHTADLTVALGGRVILSEFPELCGVEQELIDRCVSDEVASRFSQLMTRYANQAAASGSGFDKNPSPGNIKDGLITGAIKSAGAARKGGTSPVTSVLGYPEQITQDGLALLCTPGNDVESTTGLAGAGANIIIFTTGLGTPTGNPVSPVIKVSSNSSLASRLPDIIDFDAGPIISGEKSIQDVGSDLLDYVIEVASGRSITRATELGQDDFIPWKQGVSL